jgi:hypothetical protein
MVFTLTASGTVYEHPLGGWKQEALNRDNLSKKHSCEIELSSTI